MVRTGLGMGRLEYGEQWDAAHTRAVGHQGHKLQDTEPPEIASQTCLALMLWRDTQRSAGVDVPTPLRLGIQPVLASSLSQTTRPAVTRATRNHAGTS